MTNLKKHMGLLMVFLLVASSPAEVRVFIQDSNTVAQIKYECSAGEVVRAFALDVSVDRGRIIGISDFFRGGSTAAAQGYGIFPASFRDHITIGPGTNVNWDVSDYTPLAVTADYPGDTFPGLNSSGVTLEFGALWNPDIPAAIPGPTGTLCSLRISERATVSVAANSSRGGVVAAEPGTVLSPVFTGAVVQPPEITGLSLTNRLLTITFAGGELETATSVVGSWTGTGNASGQYTESVEAGTWKFYRVRSP
jgi:hypothetical protein